MPHPLAIAAAIYGGYRGYKSAKKSGASGLGRILGAAAGAYGGYSLGNMIPTASASAPAMLSQGMNTNQFAALKGTGATELTKQAVLNEGTKKFGLEELKQMLLMNEEGKVSP